MVLVGKHSQTLAHQSGMQDEYNNKFLQGTICILLFYCNKQQFNSNNNNTYKQYMYLYQHHSHTNCLLAYSQPCLLPALGGMSRKPINHTFLIGYYSYMNGMF